MMTRVTEVPEETASFHEDRSAKVEFVDVSRVISVFEIVEDESDNMTPETFIRKTSGTRTLFALSLSYM